MGTYEDLLRGGKKIELSSRVTSSIVEDIWCMSYLVEDAEEFTDYLMTVTNSEAIEEFFNKCHDEGGRFCGGPSGSGHGPGTRIPAPIDYVKQQVREKAKITGQRYDSDAVSKVTTSPIRHDYGVNPSGYGTVKIRRLQKAKLSEFKTAELTGLKTRLQSSQRQYNSMNTVGLLQAAAAAGSAVTIATPLSPLVVGLGARAAYNIGVSRWKTKRIPIQIKRINREISKRSKLSASGLVELAIDDDTGLPTLAEEIAIAKKEIEGGNLPKASKFSAVETKEYEELLADIDNDDDLGAEQIAAIKESYAEYKKSLK